MSLFANTAGIDYRMCPDYQFYVQDIGTLKVTEVRSEDGRTADTAELGGWEQAMNKIENAPPSMLPCGSPGRLICFAKVWKKAVWSKASYLRM